MRKLIFLIIAITAFEAFAQRSQVTARDRRLTEMKDILVNSARASARSEGQLRQALQEEVLGLLAPSSTRFRIGIIDHEMTSIKIPGTRDIEDRAELAFSFNCTNVPMMGGIRCISLQCRSSINVSQFLASNTTDTLAIYQVTCTNSQIPGLETVNAVIDISAEVYE